MTVRTDTPSHASQNEHVSLERLQTRMVDALSGYDKMAEHAEPGFRPTVDAFRALHQTHIDRIAPLLGRKSRSQAGSIMGTVNRVVVATRAIFDEIDEDVLEEIRSGEGHVLDAFDEALSNTTDSTLTEALAAMRQELVELLASTTPRR
jgi:hypothetical protein